MRKYFIITVLIALSVYGFGCERKKKTGEESQELLSMDQLNAISTNTTSTATSAAPAVAKPVTEVKTAVKEVEPAVAAKLEPLPPAGPYKPSGLDIQTALKNAGYYTGTVDGKLGPMTKEAIEEFQKANGLEADGRVGPKTWAALRKHLTSASSAVSSSASSAAATMFSPKAPAPAKKKP